MKKFARHKTFDEVKAQCEAAGIHFNDIAYRGGADTVFIRTQKDTPALGEVCYNTFNGVFWGTTPEPNSVSFESGSTKHDSEPWFQALLSFFYVEKAS